MSRSDCKKVINPRHFLSKIFLRRRMRNVSRNGNMSLNNNCDSARGFRKQRKYINCYLIVITSASDYESRSGPCINFQIIFNCFHYLNVLVSVGLRVRDSKEQLIDKIICFFIVRCVCTYVSKWLLIERKLFEWCFNYTVNCKEKKKFESFI